MSNFNVWKTEGNALAKVWNSHVAIEPAAEDQVRVLCTMPFIFKHVAVMPDCHSGLGSTVGTVIATDKALIPAAVGVDIGCGMCAANTGLSVDDLGDLRDLRMRISAAVPNGRTDNGGLEDRGAWFGNGSPDMPKYAELLFHQHWQVAEEALPADILRRELYRIKARNQLGTLGTGNHFIELSSDGTGRVWLVVHSGSRGIGNVIGQYFIRLAQKVCNQYFVTLPDKFLAYLPENTPAFDQYVSALKWAQDYAKINRQIISHEVCAILGVTPIDSFDCHHNYAEKEHHFNRDVWVTRKGAIRARIGDAAIIPGSMGTPSYIVEGKGCPDSFCSASHGAGRTMSRTKAIKTLSLEDHQRAMAGVEAQVDAKTIDESPLAYKPIDEVIKSESDLVSVKTVLHPILNVKGV